MRAPSFTDIIMLCVYAGIVHADLYDTIRIAKDDGMSFQAIATNRNELVNNMMLRNNMQYLAVAQKRLAVAKAVATATQQADLRREGLLQELAKFYPGLALDAALAKALEPAPFMPQQVGEGDAAGMAPPVECGLHASCLFQVYCAGSGPGVGTRIARMHQHVPSCFAGAAQQPTGQHDHQLEGVS